MGNIGGEEINSGKQLCETKERKSRYRFVTVGWKDRRTHRELGEGTPLFRNEGFVGVQLVASSFTSLLHKEGLSPTFINGIEVVFRPAYLADRDFFSKPLGGINIVGSGLIEVYTTLLAEQVGARHIHIPVNRRTVVRKLLHEIGHEVEIEQIGQPAGSYAVPKGNIQELAL